VGRVLKMSPFFVSKYHFRNSISHGVPMLKSFNMSPDLNAKCKLSTTLENFCVNPTFTLWPTYIRPMVYGHSRSFQALGFCTDRSSQKDMWLLVSSKLGEEMVQCGSCVGLLWNCNWPIYSNIKDILEHQTIH